MSFLVRVFHVTISDPGTDMVPFSAKVIKGTLDVFRHIFEIPFIYKSVDLPGFFVAFNRCIRSVDHADEPDTPNREEAVDVFFHELHFTGESCLRLAQDDTEFTFPCVRNQPVELWARSVCTGIVVIVIDVIDSPSMFRCEFKKH